MKKALLTIAISLIGSYAFSQTIAVNGTSGTITPGGTFDTTISLSITGNNSIGNVESLNLLLGTPSTGIHSGAGLFSVYVNGLVSPFNNTTGASNSGNQSTFATAGDAANSGNTISTPTTLDLGANTTSPVSVASTGTTAFNVETLRFTASNAIAPGVYNFFATSGGAADSQGTFIDNSSNATFGVNSTPVFTLTVVPEPATCSLLAFGGVGTLALQFLRARNRA